MAGDFHIENKKSEKAVKAVLDALGVKYELEESVTFPEHVITGVRRAQEDVKVGQVKKYEGLNTLLNQCRAFRT
ncbi:hypothetical protein [Parapedobacter sp. DT-150]|uniref:hypothetical protein n=1 Tax=Parapedobacter sp. DT-150 TaxID=3396162 RepID=UPI003F1BFF9A